MSYSLNRIYVHLHWMNDERKPAGWHDIRHNTGVHSFYWIYGGSGLFHAEEGSCEAGTGTLLYLKPGLSLTMETVGSHMDIVMALTDLIGLEPQSAGWTGAALIEPLRLPFRYDASAEETRAWTQRLQAVRRNWVPGSEDAELAAQTALLEWIAELHRLRSGERLPSDARLSFERIRGELERRYAEPLHIHELCAGHSLSPSYARKLFLRYIGEPPKEYLTRIRNEQSKKLLQYTDMPLKAVAAACGYLDEFHFGKMFKRLNGIPPGSYRTEHRAAAPGAERQTPSGERREKNSYRGTFEDERPR